MIQEPTYVFAFLAGCMGVIHTLSTLPKLQKFFSILPPVIWFYFVPMFATTLGILPAENPVYSWISRYLLPLSLFWLMLTIDVRAILRLGRMALLMMLAGTVGVVIGGPIAYAITHGILPEDAWKGLAALSGSWIGGTANLIAIQQSVGAPDSALGPIIIVDTVVGYGWMGIMLLFTSFQQRFDRWNRADTSALEDVSRQAAEAAQQSEIPAVTDASKILGLGFVAAILSVYIAQFMPEVGEPSVISRGTWAVLIVVTVGLALSFTPLRKLDHVGASRFGFVALNLLICSIGARADLKMIVEAPQYLLAGVIWISIHVAILFAVARLIRAPLFFVATGSMANIGGAASAPVVAASFRSSLAPIGVLMGVAGYILGIYAALLCAWMLSQLSLIL